MADIFGRRDQVLMGGLSSDSMFMTWPELDAVGGGLGMLIQRAGLEYRQPIRRIFEVGPGVVPAANGGFESAAPFEAFCEDFPAADICQARTQPTYYIVGRPEGRLQLNRFVGPNVLAESFYTAYGSPCGPNVMTLTGRATCSAADVTSPTMEWILNGVTVDGLNMDVTAQEMVIQEGITTMFAGLNLNIITPL